MICQQIQVVACMFIVALIALIRSDSADMLKARVAA